MELPRNYIFVTIEELKLVQKENTDSVEFWKPHKEDPIFFIDLTEEEREEVRTIAREVDASDIESPWSILIQSHFYEPWTDLTYLFAIKDIEELAKYRNRIVGIKIDESYSYSEWLKIESLLEHVNNLKDDSDFFKNRIVGITDEYYSILAWIQLLTELNRHIGKVTDPIPLRLEELIKKVKQRQKELDLDDRKLYILYLNALYNMGLDYAPVVFSCSQPLFIYAYPRIFRKIIDMTPEELMEIEKEVAKKKGKDWWLPRRAEDGYMFLFDYVRGKLKTEYSYLKDVYSEPLKYSRELYKKFVKEVLYSE